VRSLPPLRAAAGGRGNAVGDRADRPNATDLALQGQSDWPSASSHHTCLETQHLQPGQGANIVASGPLSKGHDTLPFAGEFADNLVGQDVRTGPRHLSRPGVGRPAAPCQDPRCRCRVGDSTQFVGNAVVRPGACYYRSKLILKSTRRSSFARSLNSNAIVLFRCRLGSSTARAIAAPMRSTPVPGTPRDVMVFLRVSRTRRRLWRKASLYSSEDIRHIQLDLSPLGPPGHSKRTSRTQWILNG